MEMEKLLTPQEMAPVTALANRALGELDAILIGRAQLHRMVMVGVLSRGHILLEGLPGLGKTALVKALGQLLGLAFSRVQFTPDLMPGDILGAHILEQSADGSRKMRFQEGPIFTNILLADEINRASPKTQSALLEAMQERCVTLLGVTRTLPDPFFVLASQNPIELEGTYPLPEAQLDRFLFKLSVSDVTVETLDRIISTRRRGEAPSPTWRMSAAELGTVLSTMEKVVLPKPVARYVARIVAATHPAPGSASGSGPGSGPGSGEGSEATGLVNKYVTYGASPRAAIAMAEAGRASALIAGRPTVGFEDVKLVAPHVLCHRVMLNYQARFDRVTTQDVVKEVLGALDPAQMRLPAGVAAAGGERS